MPKTFEETLSNIKRKNLGTLVEEAIKQTVILPLLNRVGWETEDDDEVKPEHPTGKGLVDYALRIGNANRVFVEAKAGGVDLKNCESQIEDYCRVTKPSLAVLTNGRQWWLYLPPTKGKNARIRRFLEFDITDDGLGKVEENFRQFLARDRMSSKQSVNQTVGNAHSLLRERIDDAVVMQGLTEAWNELATDEQTLEFVVAKLAERREIQAKETQFKQFLHSKKPSVNTVTEAKKPISFPKPAKFTFKAGDGQPVVRTVPKNKGWNELLVGVCELMLERRPEAFNKVVLEMPKWFSKSSGGLKSPKPIGDTGIYVEFGGRDAINKLIPSLVTKCGYSPGSLTIQEK